MHSLSLSAHRYFPGLAIAAVVALSAQFLADHYGPPAMLMAILIGLALNFLGAEARTAPGITLAARHVLRLGVALLGIRISADMLLGLGALPLVMVALSVPLIIGFGLLLSRLLGQPGRFGFLTGGSVAICGASAAMAIGALLPQDDRRERDIAFTVIAVTVLSTLAMILYPIIAANLGLSTTATGLLLGGTIHDVAQVVGAGFSVSTEVGEVATLFKLFRVIMLAPAVVIGALILRGTAAGGGTRPPLVPGFVLGFLLLAGANSFGLIPVALRDLLEPVVRACLLMAIGAVGLRTDLRGLMSVGITAALMLLAETVLLFLVILAAAICLPQ